MSFAPKKFNSGLLPKPLFFNELLNQEVKMQQVYRTRRAQAVSLVDLITEAARRGDKFYFYAGLALGVVSSTLCYLSALMVML